MIKVAIDTMKYQKFVDSTLIIYFTVLSALISLGNFSIYFAIEICRAFFELHKILDNILLLKQLSYILSIRKSI